MSQKEVKVQILVNDEVKHELVWAHPASFRGKNTLTGKLRTQLDNDDIVSIRVVPTEVSGVEPEYTVHPKSSLSVVRARQFG